MKPILQKVNIFHAPNNGKNGKWFPTSCTTDDLFPVDVRTTASYLHANLTDFIELLLKKLDFESGRRMYTDSITGGTTRKVNLITKNLNYWIIQLSDYGPASAAFRWTKGTLARDRNGFLTVRHKYVAEEKTLRFGGHTYKVDGAFFICLGSRLENVPCYGGRFKTWLVTKFPKLKKRLGYTTHPRIVVHMSIHIDSNVAYVFDIASVDVTSEQTVNAYNKEQKVQYESGATRSTFRSEGALRLRKTS